MADDEDDYLAYYDGPIYPEEGGPLGGLILFLLVMLVGLPIIGLIFNV